MKANELMLGDWIYHKDEREAGQVYEIREDFIEIDVDLPKEGQACWIDGEPEEFEGIELTENMLLENGWTYNPYDKDWTHLNTNKIVIEQVLEDGRFVYSVLDDEFTFTYAHELQHIFRLVGLDKMADNFKIN